MSRVLLLGVPIDPVSRQEAVLRLRALLHTNRRHHIVTPNSEMLVESTRNPAFRTVLWRAALALPDSTGLLWAARRTGQHLPERVTGVDTVMALCRELDGETPVFLLGGGPAVAERAAHALMLRNPRLVVAGTFAGTPREEDAEDIIGRINASGAVLLLVAYGAPQQDLWIDRSLRRMTTVRVAMGVGGTFDFLAGVQRRAPHLFQRFGLEWLWRLILEPRRIKRIFTAVVVFPWMVRKYGRKGR